MAVDRLGFHTLHVLQTFKLLCFGLDDAVYLFLLELTDTFEVVAQALLRTLHSEAEPEATALRN